MRGILLTREDHIAFLQKESTHKHIYPKATKSLATHLMSITSKVVTSYLAYHGDQSIWEKHISMAYDTNVVYYTKMQTWYDT
jgi:4'-phosphopantetheinyl transferase EntD